MFFYLSLFFTCLVWLSSGIAQKCDDKVLQCIKDVNGGAYPIRLWAGLGILWNREYSIVWYSQPLVEEQGMDCIKTVFGLFGATDTYYKECVETAKIKFETSLGLLDKTFTIKDYQGMNMKAYAIHYRKYCLGLYVCSPYGVAGPHVTIYCPTALLNHPAVMAEVEEAKGKLTQCNINDGVALCKDQKNCG